MSAPARFDSGLPATAATMALREFERLLRTPQLLVFTLFQPLLFLLLFTFVLGGAIDVPGTSYTDYLVPGILVMTAVFNSSQTAVSAADEVTRGVVDRFRTLPVSRAGVLCGRAVADVAHNAAALIIVTGAGLALGFRPADWGGLLAAGALLLLFGFGFSWFATAVGLSLRSVDTVQAAAFAVMLPLMFVSSVFVPLDTMPQAVAWAAQANPITWVSDATRALIGGTPDFTATVLAAGAACAITALSAVASLRAFEKD